MNAILQAASSPAQSSTDAPANATQWSVAEVEALYELPLMDLIFRAQQVHRENFDANEIQRSTLISVKTGSRSFSIGPRQAAPMQKRVAPLAFG